MLAVAVDNTNIIEVPTDHASAIENVNELLLIVKMQLAYIK